MIIRITAPKGKMLRDTRSLREYSEVVCDEKQRHYYVLADGSGDTTVETLDGVTLADRVSDLEDAVIELAEIISEEVGSDRGPHG